MELPEGYVAEPKSEGTGWVVRATGGRWRAFVGEQWRVGRMESSPGSWIAHYPQHLTPNPAVLGDVRFRRALIHALDRQEMSDTIQAGLAPIAHGWVEVTRPEYREVEPSMVKYAFDPRRSSPHFCR